MADDTVEETPEEKSKVPGYAGGVAAGVAAIPLTAAAGAWKLKRGFQRNREDAETMARLQERVVKGAEDGSTLDAKIKAGEDPEAAQREVQEIKEAAEKAAKAAQEEVRKFTDRIGMFGKETEKAGFIEKIRVVWNGSAGSGEALTKTKALMIAIPVVAAVAVGAFINKMRGSHAAQIAAERATAAQEDAAKDLPPPGSFGLGG